MKERAPKSLDEALCIALRLEAWAKSVKQDKQEDDRPERHRQKARSTAKPDTVKPTQNPQSNDRLTKIEAGMTKLHEEIKKLLEVSQTPCVSTAIPATHPASAPVQRPATHATPSAGERQRPQFQNTRNNGPVRPLMSSSFPQQRQPPIYWNCSLPGHIIRDCPTRNRPMYGPAAGNNLANRGSTKMQDQANVYLKMSLLGKEVPCLVDTGCELTLVPKDLISRFTNVEVRPSIRHVWAANNTPIRIEGEVRLPFKLDEKCLWTTALISEDVEEVMLGIDWLEAHGCVWDFKTGQLCINGQPATILSRCRQDRVQCVKSKVSKNQQSTKDLSQVSVGEAMFELQQQDSDIGPILRLRIQQTNQPQLKKFFPNQKRLKSSGDNGIV